eukprot:COSAG04_NODE_4710_length_1935_cov_1.540305_3_plen_265_part_00
MDEDEEDVEEEEEDEPEEEEPEEEEEPGPGGAGGGRSLRALAAALLAAVDGARSNSGAGVLGAAAALPDAAGMAAETEGAGGDALLDQTADASVSVLAVLHKATQLCSAAVSEAGAGAAALPGELDDARFLKGLRLGAADQEAVAQYVEMGLWRRILWLNQLALSAADEAADTGGAERRAADAEAAEPTAGVAGYNFNQWYTEEYTQMLGDELDAVRQQAAAGFSARDVSALIGCINGGAAVLGSLAQSLSGARLAAPSRKTAL